MIDDPQSVAGAGKYGANAVLDVGAIKPARALHRPVARGEDHRIAAPGVDRVPHRLRPRALLDEQKIAAGIVLFGLAQEADKLQRERQFAVEILVQAVVAARLIVQEQRRRLTLPGRPALRARNRASPAGNRASSPSASIQRLAIAASGG